MIKTITMNEVHDLNMKEVKCGVNEKWIIPNLEDKDIVTITITENMFTVEYKGEVKEFEFIPHRLFNEIISRCVVPFWGINRKNDGNRQTMENYFRSYDPVEVFKSKLNFLTMNLKRALEITPNKDTGFVVKAEGLEKVKGRLNNLEQQQKDLETLRYTLK